MKIYKFEIQRDSDRPIVRLTLKRFLGGFYTRDVIQSYYSNNRWRFMDNGELLSEYDSINHFVKMKELEYSPNI